MNLAQTLETLFAPVIEGLGLTLWGIETVGGDGQLVVRVFIEREGGVDVDDCAKTSRHLSLLLDVEDPVPGRYRLEVSSPGLERPFFRLDQVRPHVGGTVEVKLHTPTSADPARRNYKGVLLAVTDDSLKVEVDGEDYVLPWANVSKCRLRVTDWDAVKKGKQPR
ncbi:ribosome maturation factor RimP [Desulfovibrio sp. X2]|uniref:ribosome maturation factor RimP n=1 Tax=Desulfovibrio sp. X2 TaxID=941449 RepID=UPI001F46F765|nr:ribosome maturation factor RimP [Desulfovibrio sp. X2]